MYTYATLTDIRQALAAESQTADSGQDAIILKTAREVTARFSGAYPGVGFAFVPETDTRYHDAIGYHIQDNALVLDLPTPMLEITQVKVNGTALANTAYFPYPQHAQPIHAVRLATGNQWSTYSSTYHETVEISGVYGYNRDYSNAWLSSGDTVQNSGGLTTATMSIEVADADGENGNLIAPRFEVGMILRIGSELMIVLRVDASSNPNTIMVKRRALGSTATAHDNGAAIEVWQVEPAIVQACKTQAAFEYMRRGSFKQVEFDNVSQMSTSYPTDFLPSVYAILDSYRDRRVRYI